MYKNPMHSIGSTVTASSVPDSSLPDISLSGNTVTDNKEVILELLSGISSCFIYVPVDYYTQQTEKYIGSILGSDYLTYKEEKTVVIKTRKQLIESKSVPEDITLHAIFEDTMRAHLACLKCKCGCTTIHSDALHRLPSEGWEEMVDAWSCHSREFEHLAQKPLRPRKTGLLFHPLYFLIGTDRSPACLKNRTSQDPIQVFYNEVSLSIPDECLLFHYLYEVFQVKKKYQLNKNIELVCLELTQIYKGPISTLKKRPNPVTALKLAYKKIDHSGNTRDNTTGIVSGVDSGNITDTTSGCRSINTHFTASLLRILSENSTGTWNEEGEITFIRVDP